MAKHILGVIAGVVVWVVVVTIAGVIMRGAWPEYASVADAMTFTLPMMIARLSIGVVATLAAGWIAGVITNRSTIATLLPGILLLVAFIPQHISLWEKFPIWYHLTFLVSLIPLTFVGGKMARNGAQSAPARERSGAGGPRERPSRGVGRAPPE